jgi:hypothetical protein
MSATLYCAPQLSGEEEEKEEAMPSATQTVALSAGLACRAGCVDQVGSSRRRLQPGRHHLRIVIPTGLGGGALRLFTLLCVSLGGCLDLRAAESSANYLPLHLSASDDVTPLLGNQHIGFYPRASATTTYDDNVTLRPTNPPDDFIWTFSPGFTLLAGESSSGIGPTTSIRANSLGAESRSGGVANRGLMTTSKGFTIDYGAALRYFSKNSEQNAVDHAARLNAALPFERLKLQLSQDVQSLSDTSIDFGNRTRRQLYDTQLGVSYSLSDLTSLQLDARQSISSFKEGIGSREWQGNGYVNYAYSPKLTVGVGGGGGLLDPNNASSQKYMQGRLRVGYQLTERVQLDASGGMEFRNFSDGGGSTTQPVFDLGAAYALSPQVTLRLQGGRRSQSSALFTGQNYNETHVGLTAQYQPVGRVSVYAAFDYNHLAYEAAQTGARATRSDDYLSLRVGVGIDLALRWSLGLYYQYKQNASADPFFDYANNQAGVSVAWAY